MDFTLNLGLTCTLLLLLPPPGVSSLQGPPVSLKQCPQPSDSNWRLREHPTDTKAFDLLLNNCSITNIKPKYFAGLPNLINIELRNNAIAQYDPDVFRSVPTLKELDLSSNMLAEIPKFTKDSCSNLRHLYLSNNTIIGINCENTFTACAKLELIDLSHNYIEVIHPHVFRPLENLFRLYLNYNHITFLSIEMFMFNFKLDSLFIDHNRISYLPKKFMPQLAAYGVRLGGIYYGDNPWQCGCLEELRADLAAGGWLTFKIPLSECTSKGNPCYRDELPCRLP